MRATGVPGWMRIALGGGGAMFLCMGLGRFSYTAMVPALIQSGQLSALEAGYVGGFNLAGFMVGAWLSETLRHRIPFRWLTQGAIWLAFAAMVASAAPWGFAWLAFWRGMLGVCTGLVMVNSLALSTVAAPPERHAAAAACVFGGVGLGILFAGAVLPWLLDKGLMLAWAGAATVGFAGLLIAVWGWAKGDILARGGDARTAPLPRHAAWRCLVAAHFLFAFALVPHTIYWVDFLVRDVGLSIAAAGLHWSLVGVASFCGPFAMVWIAGRIGIVPALLASYLLLGAGIGGPALLPAVPVLWLSTLLFGSQPGVATALAARGRSMATAENTPRIMRALIFTNASAVACAGLTLPLLFAAGGYDAVFLAGGAAMLAGAVLVLPRVP